MSLQTTLLPKPGPFTLWVCEACDHTWWALRPETHCPNEECRSEEIAAFEDHPEQPRCEICNRPWQIKPVVRFGCCEDCWEDKR